MACVILWTSIFLLPTILQKNQPRQNKQYHPINPHNKGFENLNRKAARSGGFSVWCQYRESLQPAMETTPSYVVPPSNILMFATAYKKTVWRITGTSRCTKSC